MYFRQLFNSGIAGVAEWRNLWNQQVLPYLRSARIVAGPGVRVSQRPAGTVIEVVTAAGLPPSTTNLTLAAVVTQPTGGAGAGAVQIATPTVSGGVILTSGASIPVVMPYLDGAN